MNELTLSLSPNAIEVMRKAGWKYYPSRGWFERSYYQCDGAASIARDISDYTGYKVSDYDTSIDKGYWHVSLANDDECLDFARRYDAYHDALRRIEHVLFNRTLVLTKEQYNNMIHMVLDYEKRFLGDQYVLIAIPEDETTKSIIAILDALGM